MKKKTLLFLAVAVLTIAGIVTTVKTTSAYVNPDCPNGCVGGDGGCDCNGSYPQYAEANWH